MNSFVMVCLHWPKQLSRLTELGSLTMYGSVHAEPGPRLMQISIASVHILSVSVSVLGSVNKS